MKVMQYLQHATCIVYTCVQCVDCMPVVCAAHYMGGSYVRMPLMCTANYMQLMCGCLSCVQADASKEYVQRTLYNNPHEVREKAGPNVCNTNLQTCVIF